jgi:hypothetical protein
VSKLLLVLGLVGCTDGTEPVDPPIEELPAGVWEPAPGAWIWDASLTVENGTVWWAYLEHRPVPDGYDDNDVWLAATTATGERRTTPSRLDADDALWSPQVAVTPSAVLVAMRGPDTQLRAFDRSGTPLGASSPIVLEAAIDVRTIELVATASGGAQLVAALVSDTAEVGIVDLDANGAPTGTVLVGTPDSLEPGGTATNAIAAASRPDGSTIVAWDRHYNGCISTRPGNTQIAPVTGQTVGTIQLVGDEPERSEALPAVAAAGTTAYIAWQSGYGSMPLQLAKYPDVSTVLAEIGDANETNLDVMIALAAPGRGAIAWRAESAGTLNVMAFTETGGIVQLGTPRVLPAVHANFQMDAVGLEHVGDDRYVLGWIEARGVSQMERLYATELDFANEALRVAPPVETRPRPAASAARRRLPCP